MELHDLTLTQAAKRLAAKELSSVELTRASLARIGALEPRVHAFVTVDAEGALKAAQAADERRAKGESGPLLGIPLALKDNLSTRGLRTTCSSKMLEPYVPPYDASVVTALRKAGAVVLGKTNLDEFAMGS
ncbi:MAG TPA: amidase, partial [bacterium]|nr:amidase [bacterium]